MARPLDATGPDTAEDVEATYKACRDPRARERLLAVHMAQQGDLGLRGIAKALMRHRSTVSCWLAAFRRGGIADLLAVPEHKGRHPTPSVKALVELDEGLVCGRWKDVHEIRAWLKEEHHVTLSLGGVYYWLNRLRASWKVPRTNHVEKDPAEVEAFKEQFQERLGAALAGSDGKPVHVWVEDEYRIGLWTKIHRVWTAKGLQPVVPFQQKRESEYVYAGLDALTGAAVVIYAPTVSLEWTKAFLEQVVATDPEGVHVVIWDGAGYHPLAEDKELPAGIRLLPLPAHSPELNPTEALWQVVKKGIANVAHRTLATVEAAATKALRPFLESAQRVSALLGQAWLTQEVLAFAHQKLRLNPI